MKGVSKNDKLSVERQVSVIITKNNKVLKGCQTFLAYLGAGFLVPTLWAYLASPFGGLAGVVAGFFIIAPIWYLVHYKGMIVTPASGFAVDIGLAIGLAIFFRDVLTHGAFASLASLPTVVRLCLGASLAGVLVARQEKKEV